MVLCNGSYYIIVVYNKRGYIEIVKELADQCMQAAVDEVKMRDEYTTNGEVID